MHQADTDRQTMIWVNMYKSRLLASTQLNHVGETKQKTVANDLEASNQKLKPLHSTKRGHDEIKQAK